MEVEILYFDGCPSHMEAQATLKEVLSQGDVTAEVRLVAVESDEEARRRGGSGSPAARRSGWTEKTCSPYLTARSTR